MRAFFAWVLSCKLHPASTSVCEHIACCAPCSYTMTKSTPEFAAYFPRKKSNSLTSCLAQWWCSLVPNTCRRHSQLPQLAQVFIQLPATLCAIIKVAQLQEPRMQPVIHSCHAPDKRVAAWQVLAQLPEPCLYALGAMQAAPGCCCLLCMATAAGKTAALGRAWRWYSSAIVVSFRLRITVSTRAGL